MCSYLFFQEYRASNISVSLVPEYDINPEFSISVRYLLGIHAEISSKQLSTQVWSLGEKSRLEIQSWESLAYR